MKKENLIKKTCYCSNGKRAAFTLAEVLITLSILGIVAAITIPSLINRNTEKQIVTKVKKFYSTMNTAFDLMQVEEGPVNTIGLSGNTCGKRSDAFMQKIAPYIQITKLCPAGDNSCLDNNITYKTLDGTRNWAATNPNWGCYSKALLKDGSLLFIIAGDDNNNFSRGELNVDINGEKGPNKLGVDTFHFIYDQDLGLTPYGFNSGINFNTDCNKNYKNNSNNGDQCSAWIIQKNNMDYLH